jgi:type IV pilus assembly protein PilM
MSQQVPYSKLFTPPRFLEMASVSVEIKPRGITFLSTKNTERGLLPDVYGVIPLPENAVAFGEIIKKEPVIKALVEIKKRTKVDFVRYSIPEEKSYIFMVNLPLLKPKEMRDILDFKIEENVSLSAKEAVFDYDIVPGSTYKSNLDVVVSVVPLDIVEEMQSLCLQAGLTPISFSSESSNVARSVIKSSNEQVIIVVYIREANIILSLVVHGVVCQTSSVNFGSSTFTDLLAKYFKVSLAEAEEIKKEKLYTDNPDNMEVFSYLINTISAIKDELFKFISYCNEREDVTGQVDRVILCGQDALMMGFDKYLSLNLDIRVDVANVWVNNFDLDKYVPDINHVASQNLLTVNGLSLL